MYIDKYSKAEKSHIFPSEKQHCIEYKIEVEILSYIKAFLTAFLALLKRTDASD
jgi:hypothetical protein